MIWPDDLDELAALQLRLGRSRPAPISFGPGSSIGGCFVCLGRGGGGPGAEGDGGWAAAAVVVRRRCVDAAVVTGAAGAPYVPGLLAAREGRLLEQAVRSLYRLPDVLLVNATGRDHPRRAGMATHLGWALDVPTVGVTHRPLVASGDWPPPETGAATPLSLEGEHVGWWLRTTPHARPLAVSPGWRMDLAGARAVVLGAAGRVRTPEPLRIARQRARRARSHAILDGLV